MPISSPGSMIGRVIPIRTPLRKRMRAFASGERAAAVPTTEADQRHLERDVERGPERVLELVVAEHVPVPSSVQPVIGNVPSWFALKLNRTSTAIGANTNG